MKVEGTPEAGICKRY